VPTFRRDHSRSNPSCRPANSGNDASLDRSIDGGVIYECISLETFSDRVPLPRGWLYAAADHQIDVVRETDVRG